MTEEPLYNIGVVTRVTGIPIPTLHAWDRRYGFPQAARTAGGHRLYSEKDIARLRWVKSQMESGLTVSRAIAAARAIEADGRLFLPAAPEPGPRPGQNPAASSLCANLFEALTHHDLPAADRMLGEMLAFHSLEDLTLEVIGPVLARIGEAWETGQLSVASEHLASNYLRHRMLMWMVTGPTHRPVNPVILACAPGEWHEGSLLMLGVLLRRRGWPVTYLGQNMPLHDLSKFSNEIKPAVIVLIAMREETAKALVEWPKWIPQTGGKPIVAFGGRAFITQPGLKTVVPGLYLGDSLIEGVQKLGQLLAE